MASSPAYAEHPQHRVEIEGETCSARVLLADQIVAESSRARVLLESRCPPRIYLPREDVQLAFLERTEHTTWCKFKGHASYYSLRVGDVLLENAVWSYEDPFDQVAAIGHHLAFYPEPVIVEIREE